jgi:hypothetical protein
VAAIEERETEALRAARLWGASDAALEAEGVFAWPADRAERTRYEPLARAATSALAFDAAYAAGRALSLAAAVSEAPSL